MKYHPDTLPLLEAAWLLIMDPAAWCRRSLANDEGGHVTHPMLSNACRWCALGAVAAFAGDPHGPFREGESIEVAHALECAASAIMGYAMLPATLNDSTDHATVMRMFERACEIVQEAA